MERVFKFRPFRDKIVILDRNSWEWNVVHAGLNIISKFDMSAHSSSICYGVKIFRTSHCLRDPHFMYILYLISDTFAWGWNL